MKKNKKITINLIKKKQLDKKFCLCYFPNNNSEF
jgi:hypothetical protein